MGVGIILLFLIAIVVIVYLYKAQMYHGPFISFLIVLGVIVALVSFATIYTQYSGDFSDAKQVAGFVKFYFNWWANLIGNVGQTTGYVVSQDWFVNKTIGGN